MRIESAGGRISAAIVLILLGRIDTHGQAAFDAAVVKRSDPRTLSAVVPGVPLPGGRWSAQRATLALVLQVTYEMPLDRIIGLPDWATTERYDITAKAKTNVAPSELRNMAKTLLAERFGLRVRPGERSGTVYAIAKHDERRPLRSGLRQSSCDANEALRAAEGAGKKAVNPCGAEAIRPLGGGALRLQMRGRTLLDLVTFSGARADFDAPIVDRTGLTGTLDIDLEFQPGPVQDKSESGYAWFGTALEEQLGLKIERRTEIVDVLIIEALRRPVVD
jgi:uncharacterized protein (TIGR03435 family)